MWFDNEIHALILLATWSIIRNTSVTIVRNSFGSRSLTLDGVYDKFLNEDICNKEYGKSVSTNLIGESGGLIIMLIGVVSP